MPNSVAIAMTVAMTVVVIITRVLLLIFIVGGSRGVEDGVWLVISAEAEAVDVVGGEGIGEGGSFEVHEDGGIVGVKSEDEDEVVMVRG